MTNSCYEGTQRPPEPSISATAPLLVRFSCPNVGMKRRATQESLQLHEPDRTGYGPPLYKVNELLHGEASSLDLRLEQSWTDGLAGVYRDRQANVGLFGMSKDMVASANSVDVESRLAECLYRILARDARDLSHGRPSRSASRLRGCWRDNRLRKGRATGLDRQKF